MSVTTVFEVRQRTPDNLVTRELGLFTDETMAKQTIDWCYREVYKRVMDKGFFPDMFITQSVWAEIQLKGYNVWMVDNLNGGMPLFFTVPHLLYNQVPVVGSGTFVLTVTENPLVDPVPMLP